VEPNEPFRTSARSDAGSRSSSFLFRPHRRSPGAQATSAAAPTTYLPLSLPASAPVAAKPLSCSWATRVIDRAQATASETSLSSFVCLPAGRMTDSVHQVLLRPACQLLCRGAAAVGAPTPGLPPTLPGQDKQGAQQQKAPSLSRGARRLGFSSPLLPPETHRKPRASSSSGATPTRRGERARESETRGRLRLRGEQWSRSSSSAAAPPTTPIPSTARVRPRHTSPLASIPPSRVGTDRRHS
jgi:hypothetical protein